MPKRFRTAPMGFNKKDVVDYIEELAADKARQLEERDGRLAELEKEAAGRQEELESLRVQLGQSVNEKRELEDKLAELGDEAGEARRALDEKDGEIAGLRSALEQAGREKECVSSKLAGLESQVRAGGQTLARRDSEILRLESELKDSREEISSLKRHNLMLLDRIDGLERPKEPPKAAASQEMFESFKERLLDISKELAALAQALLEAEEAEKAAPDIGEDEYDYDDMALGGETEVIMDNYPNIHRPGSSIKSILDRIRAIGDKIK